MLVSYVIIPIPIKAAGLLFVIFGVILWLYILVDSIGLIRNARKGRTEWVWSSKKGELEPKTLKNQLGTYVVAFL